VTQSGVVKYGAGLLILYYCFAALTWRAMSAVLSSTPPKGLLDGLALLACKGALWVLPAALMARAVLHEPVAPSLGMTRRGEPARYWKASAIGFAFLAIVAGLQGMINGWPQNAAIPILPGLVLAAVNATIEEVSFRGFILRQLAKRAPFWRANLFQSLLFILVHWPGWFAHGPRWEILPMSIGLLLLALVLGWITRLTGSVWLAVVVHTINNLVASRLSGAT